MKKLTTTLLLTFAVFLGSAGVSFALPECEGSPTKYKSVSENWHACEGKINLTIGSQFGEWRNGSPNGHGTSIYKEPSPHAGQKFVGEFKNNIWHGWGTLTFSTPSRHAGDKYVGEFRDGKMHGQGTAILADGKVQKGIWTNGKFQNAQKVPPTTNAGDSILPLCSFFF